MKFLYCAFGLPHLLNRTTRATVYRAPAEEVTTPEHEKYIDSTNVHALGVIDSELVIVMGAGSRDKAALAALERLEPVEPCEVIAQAKTVGKRLLALPGDVVMYGDSNRRDSQIENHLNARDDYFSGRQ